MFIIKSILRLLFIHLNPRHNLYKTIDSNLINHLIPKNRLQKVLIPIIRHYIPLPLPNPHLFPNCFQHILSKPNRPSQIHIFA